MQTPKTIFNSCPNEKRELTNSPYDTLKEFYLQGSGSISGSEYEASEIEVEILRNGNLLISCNGNVFVEDIEDFSVSSSGCGDYTRTEGLKSLVVGVKEGKKIITLKHYKSSNFANDNWHEYLFFEEAL